MIMVSNGVNIMSEIDKLNADQKISMLLHILNNIDEQGVISFAEDKFEAYFQEYSRPLVEGYLNALNNKKTLQFMVYGEPGMVNEHFIKVTSPGKIAREIKLQIDLLKAKHKDMILAVNQENMSLKSQLEKPQAPKSKESDDDDDERKKMSEKIAETLEYGKKLKVSLRKNKNLSILEGVVNDTQGYLQTVKIINDNYDDVHALLIAPLIEENRTMMRRLTLTSVVAIFAISIISAMILTIIN